MTEIVKSLHDLMGYRHCYKHTSYFSDSMQNTDCKNWLEFYDSQKYGSLDIVLLDSSAMDIFKCVALHFKHSVVFLCLILFLNR